MIELVFDRRGMLETDHARRADAEKILVAADWLRAAGRHAPPGGWRAATAEDGAILLIDHGDQPLAALSGSWAPGSAAYLNAVAPYSGFHLAELMWLSGLRLRTDGLDGRLRGALVDLAGSLTRQAPS